MYVHVSRTNMKWYYFYREGSKVPHSYFIYFILTRVIRLLIFYIFFLIKFIYIRAKMLGIWTLFLLLTFVMLVIHVEIFDRAVWIPLIPIGAYFAFATIVTIIYFLQKK